MIAISVMAHQDDEMRCLGTLLRYRQRGDGIGFVTLTDGTRGFVQTPDIERAEAAAIRDREMRTLCSAIGAPYVNLGFRDSELVDTQETRLALIEAIRSLRADVIFTHPADDYHTDHTTTHLLVRQAAMHSSLPVLATSSPPLPTHPAIFLVEPHGPFPFHPTHYVDISAVRHEKVRLLAMHESQETAMKLGTGSGVAELTAVLDAHRGLLAGVAWAEAFTPLPTRGSIKPWPVLP